MEAQCVRDMIAEFLKQGALKGKVEKIGIVGMSYGGLQALMLGEMEKANKLPFKIDSIQVWSPPVSLYRTCEILDTWYAEDRWSYTLPELAAKLSNHKPAANDSQIPFSDEVMRAGIAAVFRLGLADTIVKNDKAYNLKVLPVSNNDLDADYVRQDYASAWGFQKFVSELTFPYWQKRLNLSSLDEMTSSFELRKLLPAQASHTEVIIACDDPFNAPEELAALSGVKKECGLTILKGGGHLGFAGEAWTKAKLMTLFKSGERLLTSK
jgi:predicted alpha/beta-fold hydrolase